jgi:hypothetical protein
MKSPKSTSAKPSSVKVQAAAKATAIDSFPRTLSNWLKKEEKTLLTSIANGLDIFEISLEMAREPLSILNYIFSTDVFEAGIHSEEEREFTGLALSGVPLHEVVLWCSAVSTKSERCPDIEDLMKIGDMRPAIEFANDFKITLANADVLESLFECMAHSKESIDAAIKSVNFDFDILTPATLLKHLGMSKMKTSESYFPVFKEAGSTSNTSRGTWYKKASRGKTRTRRSVSASGRTSTGMTSRTHKAVTTRKYRKKTYS